MSAYFAGIGSLAVEVLTAIVPIAVVTALLRPFIGPFPPGLVHKTITGLTLTFVGTVLFLQGVNIGFLPVGELIGTTLVSGPRPGILIPFGLWLGFIVALAEPAVKVLGEEVEEVSGGALSATTLSVTIAVGVGVGRAGPAVGGLRPRRPRLAGSVVVGARLRRPHRPPGRKERGGREGACTSSPPLSGDGQTVDRGNRPPRCAPHP